MKKLVFSFFFAGLSLAHAHFVTLIPERDTVRKPTVKVETLFTHPAEGYPAMHYQIEKSALFKNGKEYPLKWSVEYIPVQPGSDQKVEKYVSKVRLHGPGIYQIVVWQKPYYEPAEGVYIKQIAKVYISAFGWEEGWDKPIGAEVEIVPLTRPFGIWKGNTFVGKVLKDGKPLKGARVEIEYYNTEGVKYPNETLYTQVVKTDENGNVTVYLRKGGSYDILVSPQGYAFYSTQLDLSKDIQDMVTTIQSNLLEIKKELSQLKGDVSGISSSVNDLKNSISGIKDSVEKIKETVTLNGKEKGKSSEIKF